MWGALTIEVTKNGRIGGRGVEKCLVLQMVTQTWCNATTLVNHGKVQLLLQSDTNQTESGAAESIRHCDLKSPNILLCEAEKDTNSNRPDRHKSWLGKGINPQVRQPTEVRQTEEWEHYQTYSCTFISPSCQKMFGSKHRQERPAGIDSRLCFLSKIPLCTQITRSPKSCWGGGRGDGHCKGRCNHCSRQFCLLSHNVHLK